MSNSKDTKKALSLTFREKETIERIEKFYKSAMLLKDFFEMGFTSFPALKGIIQFYNPDVDLKKLKWFWNFNSIDDDLVQIIEEVHQKLKHSNYE
jgi:hypothetical protein